MPKRFSLRCVPAILVFVLALAGDAKYCSGQRAKRPFTVADDIELTHFDDGAEAVRFSPDGNYFAVYTERGRLDLNRPEDSLRFYRSQDVENFLEHPDELQSPSPIWIINLSTDKKGPIIKNWMWLANSSGVAFLEPTANGNQRLVLADLPKKMIKPLTSAVGRVGSFDIRDRHHYVYTAVDPGQREKQPNEREAPSIVGTGRSLFQLLIPDEPVIARIYSLRRYHLSAVVGHKPFEVRNNGTPIIPGGGWIFDAILALSPDGNSVVTTLPVAEVPPSWETLYPPAFVSLPNRISDHEGSVSQYVLINLKTGSVQALTSAPISNDAGWEAYGRPWWSNDGQEILLPNTFLNSKNHVPSRPCVAVVDLLSNTSSCVEIMKGRTKTGVEEGYHRIFGARFADGDDRRVTVSFESENHSVGTTEYQRAVDGTWQVVGQGTDVSEVDRGRLEVIVKQGLNDPPLLVAANKTTSRTIWDPNPQLKNIDLGPASVYIWQDKNVRRRSSGLYKPENYKPGVRYPLVIQPYTFRQAEFRPSGAPFTTAFAARALAAAGIVVLQGGQDCPQGTPEEGPCTVSSYEAAAKQLISDGLVDPDKIGLIGFSRSSFWVMEGLTSGSLHIKAASITDGSMENYLQYITMVDYLGNVFPHLYDSTIGAPPFGEGLQQWLRRSPVFSLDKVSAPLLVVAEGPFSVLSMWEPYAGLRYLQRPVDLIMLNTDEHALTNPAVRMASQGGTVDWFRFWLQDYEDPDPGKADQYARWRVLRKMQAGTDKSR